MKKDFTPIKILAILGPTSIGKTKLALKAGRRFTGEVISADSQQVYIGMDIATGKDIDRNSKLIIQKSKLKLKNEYYQFGYHEIGGIKIWGLDIARPDQEFSASHFRSFALEVIGNISARGKLPIIAGGTGFYFKSVASNISTINISRNILLRKQLEHLSVSELAERLLFLDRDRLERMNNSDRNNPRRLIRAIEVAKYFQTNRKNIQMGEPKCGNFQILKIGLKTSPSEIRTKIIKRVDDRIQRGVINEVKQLLDKGFGWNLSSFQSFVYSNWKCYFDKQCSLEEVRERWIKDEYRYAKRQMVWFKKDREIKWFDIRDDNCENEIIEAIKTWYTK